MEETTLQQGDAETPVTVVLSGKNPDVGKVPDVDGPEDMDSEIPPVWYTILSPETGQAEQADTNILRGGDPMVTVFELVDLLLAEASLPVQQFMGTLISHVNNNENYTQEHKTRFYQTALQIFQREEGKDLLDFTDEKEFCDKLSEIVERY
jgi:hypothetical protein